MSSFTYSMTPPAFVFTIRPFSPMLSAILRTRRSPTTAATPRPTNPIGMSGDATSPTSIAPSNLHRFAFGPAFSLISLMQLLVSPPQSVIASMHRSIPEGPSSWNIHLQNSSVLHVTEAMSITAIAAAAAGSICGVKFSICVKLEESPFDRASAIYELPGSVAIKLTTSFPSSTVMSSDFW
nr:hypothetical protein CFCDKGLG_00007 [Methanosarcinales archaeon ANME-2c ERB4]QNO45337.1 hypothetical protein MAODPDDD_00006 [Methanosarcinales archaeon ANME-2c ERB4]